MPRTTYSSKLKSTNCLPWVLSSKIKGLTKTIHTHSLAPVYLQDFSQWILNERSSVITIYEIRAELNYGILYQNMLETSSQQGN